MADEKKAVNTSKASKGEEKKAKAPKKFSPKNVGKAIGRFFKDLRGETKKIVWPSRQMVIKSTGVVLAAILVIGAGIWLLDFAISGGITAVSNAASKAETTAVETTETQDAAAEEEHDHDHDEDVSEDSTEEKSEESTTEA